MVDSPRELCLTIGFFFRLSWLWQEFERVDYCIVEVFQLRELLFGLVPRYERQPVQAVGGDDQDISGRGHARQSSSTTACSPETVRFVR